MHNAPIILNVREAFNDEEKSFWENWDEKPEIITAKDLNKEELEEFWSHWQEEPKNDYCQGVL